ncbi:MAG TPA: hypothetical protein DDW76_09280 [Cyanobacteria bacterium UBA11369]|nr:hypothetical protein [Cyanobacteria bacterium UBA11371]HBE35644.1 hypothetical protein [Cyanobacteria bacterium UBA11368]HBE48971.1 hypothetical protein [Cyanobacteria bacterium UBA11369]
MGVGRRFPLDWEAVAGVFELATAPLLLPFKLLATFDEREPFLVVVVAMKFDLIKLLPGYLRR